MKTMAKWLMFGVILMMVASAQAGAEDMYTVDAVHSSAAFKVRHLGISNVTGSFTDVAGMIMADKKKAGASSVTFTVKTASVDTHNDTRDKHLRSADFFDVKKFPTMTFKSTGVRKVSATKYEVTGNFTLHGVTKKIKVKVDFLGEGKGMQGETRAGFETVFKIKRSDYGMSGYIPVVSDEVEITISVEAVKN